MELFSMAPGPSGGLIVTAAARLGRRHDRGKTGAEAARPWHRHLSQQYVERVAGMMSIQNCQNYGIRGNFLPLSVSTIP
jgi:hypothetical protein